MIATRLLSPAARVAAAVLLVSCAGEKAPPPQATAPAPVEARAAPSATAEATASTAPEEEWLGFEALLTTGQPSTPPPDVGEVVPVHWQDGQTMRPLCTGTIVAPELILTAAHCVEADIPLFIGAHNGKLNGTAPGIPHEPTSRACMAKRLPGPCPKVDPTQTVRIDTSIDMATLALAGDARESKVALGHFSGDGAFPTMWYYGFAGKPGPLGKPQPVCVARVRAGQGQVTGGGTTPVKGDSGGPLIARHSDGRLVVLGIVSSGEDHGRTWYFTPVPITSRFPAASGAKGSANVKIAEFDDAAAFTPLVQCPPQ